MATQHNNVEQHYYSIATKAYISVNSTHYILGLMGLSIRETFVISYLGDCICQGIVSGGATEYVCFNFRPVKRRSIDLEDAIIV